MTENLEKTMNTAPGFLCPACGQMRIKLTLEAFLSSREVHCPSCGMSFNMDKSQCTSLIEMLQDLVMAAVNEASRKVDEQLKSSLGGMLGGMGLPGM